MDAVSIELRFVLTLLVEAAFFTFLIARVLRTRRQRLVAVTVALLALALEGVGFDYFVAPGESLVWSQRDPPPRVQGCVIYGPIDVYVVECRETRSPYLGFLRLRAVIIYRSGSVNWQTAEQGFAIADADCPSRTYRGPSCFLLVQEGGEVIPSQAPIFETLWAQRHALPERPREVLGQLRRAETDAPLRKFLGVPENN